MPGPQMTEFGVPLYPDSEFEDEVEEQAPNEEELPEAVAKGGRCEVKDVFYAPVPGKPDKFHWVDEKPVDETTESSKTKKEREAYAILKYRKQVDGQDWPTSYIHINNPKVQPVLKQVLEGYPGLTQYELKTFSSPFLPFFHRWDRFTAGLANETDPVTRKYLQLLADTLTDQLQNTLDTSESIRSSGHVGFNKLELAFYPGTLAYRSSNGLRAAGVYRKGSYGYDRQGNKYFDAHVDVVDWDGRRCGLLSQTWRVYEYVGLRALTALSISPLDSHPDKEQIRAFLIERGRIFEKLRGQLFMAFTNEQEEIVNRRTVVDARAFHKHGPEGFPAFASLSEIGHLTWAQSMNRYSSNPQTREDSPMIVDMAQLTDEQCMLTVATVKCYGIESKKWDKLDLTKFHEIPWSEKAFDSLVLDPSEKDLLLALVDRDEFKNSKPFDDFISGKGQGMIMLLCGPPGVGKTLTAESVAEHLRRPLYKVGAGDLGISSRSVEDCLQKSLALCSDWNAVLLIDEADVFMEARNTNNLARNELVSIFLRHLEYYSGIMILTTNRMRSIDTAFESRIDITLTYNSLTEADRKQVWRNFIQNLDPNDVDIDEQAIDRLAQWDFNGRQIKSAIKTARILAAKKKMPLNVDHLNVVLNMREKALRLSRGDEGENGDEPLAKRIKVNGS